MNNKFKALLVSIVALVGCSAVWIPANLSSAASTQKISAEPAPTPRKLKVKTLRELTYTNGEFDGQEVVKTDAEWRKLLTAEEYRIMREEGTERPYSNVMVKNHRRGTYHCAACGLALFKSDTKFESGTGWPSFFRPIFAKNVVEKVDNSLGEPRTEIECARCHAHIGHVFDDGPKPTGLRYCMNSPALRFRAGT